MAKNNKSRRVNARKKSLENFTNIYVQIKGLKQESRLMRASVHSPGAFLPPCFERVSHAYSNHLHKTRPLMFIIYILVMVGIKGQQNNHLHSIFKVG